MQVKVNVLVALALTAILGFPPRAQVLEWASCYDGPKNDLDTAFAVAVDDAGHVYVTGASRGDNSNPDYATIKYDADGDMLWVRRYNSPANEFDLGRDLLADTAGNLYVTGGPVTLKYSPEGELIWEYDHFAELMRIALDDKGS
ncbi:MAG: hypothetical protein IH855_04300, partial [Bacteroidetes bacterium]|nr:hypothetical protein [Bacteroidota bacterium]